MTAQTEAAHFRDGVFAPDCRHRAEVAVSKRRKIADSRSGARAILDDEWLPEFLREAVREQAGDDIGRRARGKRYNDGDGTRGILFSRRSRNQRSKKRKQDR